MARRSGIPTGNAGEYFTMGELLRRGYDAQLADRNTKNYDIVAGRENAEMRRIQVKTNMTAKTWFISRTHYQEPLIRQITIFVWLGGKNPDKHAVRYFITKNEDIAEFIHRPAKWKDETKTAFVSLRDIEPYEGRWDILD